MATSKAAPPTIRTIAVTLSLVTGLWSYLQLLELSFSGTSSAVLFFDRGDSFGDFFKFFATYSGKALQFPNYLPSRLFALLSLQQSQNAYTSQPVSDVNMVQYSLHGLPPITQVLGSIVSWVLVHFDPILVFGGCVFLTLAGLGYCVSLSTPGKPLARLALWLVLILSYPMLYGLDRGNIGAIATSILVVGAFVIQAKYASLHGLATILLCLAIAVRPNYLFLLPLHVVIAAQCNGKRLRISSFLLPFAILLAVLLISLLLSMVALPGYSIGTFVLASQKSIDMYVLESGGMYSSSPLGLVVGMLRRFDPDEALSLVALPRKIFFYLGVLFSLLSWYACSKRILSASQSLNLCLSANVILNPVFATYHLSVFFSPLLMALVMHSNAGASDSLQRNTNAVDCVPKKPECFASEYSRIDLLYLAFLIAPKPAILGMIFNSLLVLVYTFTTSLSLTRRPWPSRLSAFP
jgi:hypothetical protein